MLKKGVTLAGSDRDESGEQARAAFFGAKSDALDSLPLFSIADHQQQQQHQQSRPLYFG